jgi:hypothetical protein
MEDLSLDRLGNEIADLGAARERVRVARALGTLPRLAQALSRGELSYAKVRALTSHRSAPLGDVVDEGDARFMIVACSAAVNWLMAKAEKAGLLARS